MLFLWGPTGTGKTAHAQEAAEAGGLETISYQDPFILGLVGNCKNVLFDDFDWKKMSPKYWLTLCDRYPMSVNIKGGHKNWAPQTIIFTSNDDPFTWWPEAPAGTRDAIHRRMREFGEVIHMGEFVPPSQKMLTQFFAPKESGVAAGSQPELVRSTANASSNNGGKGKEPAVPCVPEPEDTLEVCPESVWAASDASSSDDGGLTSDSEDSDYEKKRKRARR